MSNPTPVSAPNENPNDYMKMYVLINREKLSLVQCGVQAAHAVAEYMHKYGNMPTSEDWVKNHKTMIFLEASETQMQNVVEIFNMYNKKFSIFYEPDLNNLMTAIAFEPVDSSTGKQLFGHLKLLS